MLLTQRIVKAVKAFVHGIVYLRLNCIFGFCGLLLSGCLCLFLSFGGSSFYSVFRLFLGIFCMFLCLIDCLFSLFGNLF